MSVVIDPGEVDCFCGCVMNFMTFLAYFQDNNQDIITSVTSVTLIDYGGELLKADNVFSKFLVITHFEPFKLIFSIGFDVERTKVGPEFGNKFVVIVRPGRVGVWVHERWFEVVECCSLEEGERVVDLVCVKLKCVRSVTEVEL